MNNYDKLVNVLREIFLLDQPDLDFGIFRIMNQKRKDIEFYLNKELVPQAKEVLLKSGSASGEETKAELDKLVSTLKAAGMNPDDSPKVKELRAKLKSGVDLDGLENEVFSHLAAFFKRYYDKGDFISMRRYKKDVYAIPYEGEEVKLHWANHDQYYIKSSEYLKNYAFILPSGQKVQFVLVEATTEMNNNKAQGNQERRFAINHEKVLEVKGNELEIYFTYDLMDKGVKQKDLLDDALEIIKKELPSEFISLLTLAPTEKDKQRTLLAKHLNDYTARNTFDYFIHKDLGGFLRRELDFYIKNEVLFIDDLNTRNEKDVLKSLSIIKAIKQIGDKVITFLAQLENFQKKLWLKKKFVIDTNYCITLDKIPEKYYAEIATNQEQLDEWKQLFAIDEIKPDAFTLAYSEPVSVEFLKQNPFLLLDTKFFSEEFKEKLLAEFDDLDNEVDGLLMSSDNFHALSILFERFSETIQCIHIDPPYNTETSGFLYKNSFKHSSWLSLMENRISLSLPLLSKEGSFLCHIDDNEYENLFQLFNSFPIYDGGTIVWDKRNPLNGGHGVATQHEYVVWRKKSIGPIYRRNSNIVSMLNKAKELINKEGFVNESVRKLFSAWVNSNSKLSGGEKAYRYIDDEGRIYQSVSLRAPEPRQDVKFHQPLIHPKTNKPCAMPPNGFSRTPETLKEMMDKGEILFGIDESIQPRQKVFLSEDTKRQLSSLIQDGKKGKADTKPLGIDFPYCHPTSLYEELLASVVENEQIVIDYFSGSGTTAHSIINLNRYDESRRKYILVEVGEYMETITKPRIQKVIYSEGWKDGKPTNRKGSSHMFKYFSLESYEDVLNNLELKRDATQEGIFGKGGAFTEDYILSYMLDVEAEGSLLSAETFTNPFDYKLNITRNNQTSYTKVDLVETFNYLIGLNVQTTERIRGFKVVTGKNRDGEKVLVIWRNLEEKSNKDLDDFFLKQNYNTRDSEFDRIFVNGDNNLENLKVGDEKWKVALIEEEFKKRMFDVKDI